MSFITDFISKNIYNEEDGIKAAPLVGAGIAGIGALFGGGWPVILMGLVGGVALSPLINSAVSWLGEQLNITSPIPGGLPDVKDRPVGEAKDATEKKVTPIHDKSGPTVGPDGKPVVKTHEEHIRVPILENLSTPEKDVASIFHRRRELMDNAVKEAQLPIGSNGEFRERLRAGWEDLTRQEKTLADFNATIVDYHNDQQGYSKKGGERDQLVAQIVDQLGIDQASATKLVPELAAVPQFIHPQTKARAIKEGKDLVYHDNPMLTHSDEAGSHITRKYRGIYESEREKGKLPKEYGNKKWEELDDFIRDSYAFNKLNEEVAQARASINVANLNPEGESLPKGNILMSGYSFDVPLRDEAKGMRQNVAAILTNLLQYDPQQDIRGIYDDVHGDIGTWMQVHANYGLDNAGGNVNAIAEYNKIKHYVDLSDDRSLLMAQMEWSAPAMQALVDFRNTGIVKSHEQSQQFLTTTLPVINQLIDGKKELADKGRTITNVELQTKEITVNGKKSQVPTGNQMVTFKDATGKEQRLTGSYKDGKFKVTSVGEKDAAGAWKDKDLAEPIEVQLNKADEIVRILTMGKAADKVALGKLVVADITDNDHQFNPGSTVGAVKKLDALKDPTRLGSTGKDTGIA